MPYTRKTRDEWELLGNYGYGHGWEHILTEDTAKEARQRLREYRENAPGYAYQIVKRRVRIEAPAPQPDGTIRIYLDAEGTAAHLRRLSHPKEG